MSTARRIIVVLGPHRCGTSTIIKALEVLGVSLGGNLMGTNQFNEKGYWEDLDFQALNKEMLAAVGRQWHHLKPFENQEIDSLRKKFSEKAGRLLTDKVKPSRPFGVKDPRFALLLAFWKPVFQEAGVSASYLLALRDPVSVAASLEARNKLLEERGYWIWILYMLEALRETQECSRVFVKYQELLRDPETQCRRMAAALGLELDGGRLDHYRDSFLDLSLDHFGTREAELRDAASCPRLAADMYQMLDRLARDQEDPDTENTGNHIARWSELFSDFQGLLKLVWKRDADFPDLAALAEVRKNEIAKCRQEITKYKEEINERVADIAWLQKKAQESELEYERLRTCHDEMKDALASVEIWQRSWLRRAFTRWHRFPKQP